MDSAVQQALARGGVIDMTTTGRRSGQPRRLEIVLHNFGGRLYISGRPSPHTRQWIRNLEADPNFVVHLKRGLRVDLPATARIITGEAERRAVMAFVARAWNVQDPRAVERMVQYSPLIEVTLADAAAA